MCVVTGAEYAWQRRIAGITGEAAVPLTIKSMRRTFWLPRRYHAILIATIAGKAFRQRDLAQRVGYSLRGLHAALESLVEMGLGDLVTVRGRLGSTLFRRNLDAVPDPTRNVSPNVETLSKTNVTTGETFRSPGECGPLSNRSGPLSGLPWRSFAEMLASAAA